ncbi:MAG: hypothetical protein ACTS6J_12975 [Burkholderiales bacterium]
MSATHARQIVAMAVAVSMVAGCAVTPPRWATPKPEEVHEQTMPYAQAYARSAMQAYQRAADREIVAGTTLGSGLIGLAGVITALAVYGAHKDALIGGALLGGTAYAIGNWSLSKQRQLVYLAGAEAINCSLTAVNAFNMSERDRVGLYDALADLEQRVGDVSVGIDAVLARKKAIPEDAASKPLHDSADQAIINARTATGAGREVLESGRQIAGKVHRAGGELVNAVDRVSVAVDKAALETIPDLASVTKVVGGIAGFATAFVPASASVDGLTKAAAVARIESRRAAAADLKVQGQKELTDALERLASLVDLLANATARVRSRTAVFDASATTESLKNCNVNVSSGLTATPSTIQLKGGAEESFLVMVAGGTKPYGADLQGAAASSGLTKLGPTGFDNTMYVKSTAATKSGTYSILVWDASNPPKSISVSVTVGSGAGAPGDGTPAPAPPPAPSQFSELVKRIEQVAAFNVDGVASKISVGKVTEKPEELVVPISCEPAATADFDLEKVKSALLLQRVAGSPLQGDLNALTTKPTITIAPTASCVASGRTESRRAAPKPVAASPEIRSIQSKLCLPAYAADGKWGPISQAGLNAWRKKNGIAESAAPLRPEERKRLLEADGATAAKWCAA